MKGDEPSDVPPYRQEHLEPEIAAMSVELLDEDEKPTVIVNVDHPEGKSAIQTVIVLAGAAVGGLVEWLRQVIGKHAAVALTGATAIGLATAALVTTPGSEPERRSPDLARSPITVHPSPRPTRSTMSTTAARPSPSAAVAPAPSVRPTPTRPTRTARPSVVASVSASMSHSEPARTAPEEPPQTSPPVATRHRLASRTSSPTKSDSSPLSSGVEVVDQALPTRVRLPEVEVHVPDLSVSVAVPGDVVSAGCDVLGDVGLDSPLNPCRHR